MTTRPAFTLIELVLALATTSLLLLGVSSAIVVASRSTYDPENDQASLARSRSVARQIADDLAQATSLIEGTATTVEFTVADRDDDAVQETIRYEWSGTKGDSIYRTINGDSAALATDIASLALAYTTTTEEAIVTGDPAEGAEELLYAFEDATLSNVPISSTSWLAMTIAPTLPADATAWSVTRLEFEAKSDGAATDTLTIKVRSSLSVLTSLLGSAITVNESTLPSSYGWTSVAVAGVTGLSPSASVSISFENASLVAAARMRYGDACEAHPAAYRSASSTLGVAWTTYDDGALNLRAYGKVTRPAQTLSTLTRLVDARVSIVSHDSSRTAGRADATFAARPIIDIADGAVAGTLDTGGTGGSGGSGGAGAGAAARTTSTTSLKIKAK